MVPEGSELSSWVRSLKKHMTRSLRQAFVVFVKSCVAELNGFGTFSTRVQVTLVFLTLNPQTFTAHRDMDLPCWIPRSQPLEQLPIGGGCTAEKAAWCRENSHVGITKCEQEQRL